MPEKRVIIRHRDGREYSVTPAGFRQHYEDQGFRIVSNEDGSRYTPPKTADAKPSTVKTADRKPTTTSRKRSTPGRTASSPTAAVVAPTPAPATPTPPDTAGA